MSVCAADFSVKCQRLALNLCTNKISEGTGWWWGGGWGGGGKISALMISVSSNLVFGLSYFLTLKFCVVAKL